MAAQFSWVATEATTGRILGDLRDLDVKSVKSNIGRYETVSASLPLPTAPEDWPRLTMSGATNLILLSGSIDANRAAVDTPIWGASINQDTPDESDTVPLSLATLESYLDGRYVGNETYAAVGQNAIVADLITKYVAAGPNGGIPIRVQIVNGGAGKLRDRTYKAQDDKTVYSVLTDLMGVIGGPEWTIGWEFSDATHITPVFYVGDRIGTAVTPGLGAAATFEMPGSVTKFAKPRDYSNRKGATTVMATSSGQGDIRPQSSVITTPDPLRPTKEYRWTPSTSIVDTATLDSYAQKAAPALANGTVTVTLSSIADTGPQLGVDWSIGDDIGWSITAPAFPNTYAGVARATGWELELSATPIVTPVLVGSQIF